MRKLIAGIRSSGRFVYCSVLQCVAVCCSVSQGVAGCCRVLQGVAVCCSVFSLLRFRPESLSVLQCALQCIIVCVAACCSVLQRVAVWCSVVQ